jgi:hypothetical protein
LDQALGLKLPQQVTASNLPEESVGLSPIPDLTETIGNVTATLLAFLSNQPPDLFQILRAESPPSKDEFSFHGLIDYTFLNVTPELSSLIGKILFAHSKTYLACERLLRKT